MRKAYLDNIRWSTVLLVMVYHVCYLFNGVGILGGIPNAKNVPVFDLFAQIVYPWFMVLLFVVSGMSAQFSLRKRTGRAFLRERTRKLLAPSTLGLFAVHWVTGYLNIKIGGGLAYIPAFLVYPISAISGIGPLWFAQTLYLFSCILILFRKPADRLRQLCGRIPGAALPLLFLPVWGAAQILNAPLLTMYRFGIYFTAFLIGYLIFSHEHIQAALKKPYPVLLAAAFVSGAAYTVLFYGTDYTAPECLQSLPANLYLWLTVLAVFGCFQRRFDRKTAFSHYMTRASFGLYVLHYPVLMVVCYVLHSYCNLPAILNYAAALVMELMLTPLLYEGIRRMPVLRFLVLGQRGG